MWRVHKVWNPKRPEFIAGKTAAADRPDHPIKSAQACQTTKKSPHQLGAAGYKQGLGGRSRGRGPASLQGHSGRGWLWGKPAGSWVWKPNPESIMELGLNHVRCCPQASASASSLIEPSVMRAEIRPALARMAASILLATSGFCFRKVLALSRPWPMRSPS